jgi:hypothetical protein
MTRVSDPYRAAADPAMPFLAKALDPSAASAGLRPWACGSLVAIRVIRYKPGRRCLIEYDFGPVTLIGKVRAKGVDHAAMTLAAALRRAGLDDTSGVRVPEPVGAVPEFGMWLQVKVPGRRSTELLARADGALLARRVADALHTLQGLNVATARTHDRADELAVLDRQLTTLAAERPDLTGRLKNLAGAARNLAGAVPEATPRGVHRDFYPDQVLVDGDRLYLLDFDLYCHGDPALDAGNFIGHLTEQAVRQPGDADALGDARVAFEDRYASLCHDEVRPAVRAYADLTLARLVAVSARIAERRPFTDRLLRLCEKRLTLRRRTFSGGRP